MQKELQNMKILFFFMFCSSQTKQKLTALFQMANHKISTIISTTLAGTPPLPPLFFFLTNLDTHKVGVVRPSIQMYYTGRLETIHLTHSLTKSFI